MDYRLIMAFFNVDKGSTRIYGYGGFSGSDAIKNNTPSGQVNAVLPGGQFLGNCVAAEINAVSGKLQFKGLYGNKKCILTAIVSTLPKTLFVTVEEDSETASPVDAVMLIGPDFDKLWERAYTLIV